MTDLDAQIDAAHRQAEETEATARQIESRILAVGGIPPARPYGKPIDPQAIRRNLTLVSIINRRDPALASYLGVQSGSYRREAEARESRIMQARAMELQTDRLREVNKASANYRQQLQNAGINPLTGRRYGC